MFQVPPHPKDADYDHLRYYTQFLHRAWTIRATELAIFAVRRRRFLAGGARLTRLTHVRPGASTPETRLAAMRAFEAIVGPCLASGEDRVVEIAATSGERRPRFCLVILARQAGCVIGAAAFIARFADRADSA